MIDHEVAVGRGRAVDPGLARALAWHLVWTSARSIPWRHRRLLLTGLLLPCLVIAALGALGLAAGNLGAHGVVVGPHSERSVSDHPLVTSMLQLAQGVVGYGGHGRVRRGPARCAASGAARVVDPWARRRYRPGHRWRVCGPGGARRGVRSARRAGRPLAGMVPRPRSGIGALVLVAVCGDARGARRSRLPRCPGGGTLPARRGPCSWRLVR